jgi:FKBP-type peptidyl-prolyl cis-trans isomerase
MVRKLTTIATLAAALAVPAAAQDPAPTAGATAPSQATVPAAAALALDTEEQKTLYALGMLLSQNLTRLELSATELAFVVAGLEDGVLKREARVSFQEYAPQVQAFAQGRFTAANERDAAAGKQFVDEMAGREGARKTESGIVVFALQEGEGASPTASDVVRVHYTGTLPNGEKFDSSVDRGEPATFPLGQVIPCWTEALQLMKVGGKARVVCPSDLAYGPQGRPGIPPNSPLVFEIELLGIGPEEPAAEPATPEATPPEPGDGSR